MDERTWKSIEPVVQQRWRLSPQLLKTLRFAMTPEVATTEDVRRNLDLTPNGARGSLQRLYDKMGVHSRTEASNLAWKVAYENGLMSWEDRAAIARVALDSLVQQGSLPGAASAALGLAGEPGRFLFGEEQVYGVGTELCQRMLHGIKTVVYGRSAKAPETWARAVATRLRETKEVDEPATYECVIAIDFENPPPGFVAGVDERFAIYKQEGVRGLVTLYVMDQKSPPTGCDVLIVDEAHVIVGIMTLPNVLALNDGLFFENVPGAGSKFAQWFDDVVLPAAVPYQKWLKKHGSVGMSRQRG